MTGALAEQCAGLAGWLPVARALTAEPDADGATGGGKPGSRPPCNSAAENAVTDAAEGVRRLEASLRLAVTGRTGRRRGGSDANTAAAIRAIEALGHGVDPFAAARAARVLERWSTAIQRLPAVDEIEPARMLRGVACPYCHYGMLAVRPRSGEVACVRKGVCPGDADGRHPVGRMDVSALTGDAQIRWNDGLVAP